MTTVGKLATYARRASIEITALPPMAAPIIETVPTPYDPRHYFYQRKMTDGVPLERSEPPLESWGKSLVGGIGILIFIIALFVTLGVR